MGILKGFLNDIFVSYGRGPQNAEGYAQERTRLLAEWSLQLVRHIKYQLQLEMPQDADLKLWVDTGLDQTIALEDSLKNNVQGSAILLVIMSNFYLQSEYCMFETSYFKSTPLDTAPKPNQVSLSAHKKPTARGGRRHLNLPPEVRHQASLFIVKKIPRMKTSLALSGGADRSIMTIIGELYAKLRMHCEKK
jgi:hypothetical protein